MSTAPPPQAFARLEAELVSAHRSLRKRRRRRTGFITAAAIFALAAGTGLAAVAYLGDDPIQVPDAPVLLPGAIRSQVDVPSLRFASEADGRAYFTADGATPGTVCLLAAPVKSVLVSSVACDSADTVAAKGIYLSDTAADKSRRVGALIGVDATSASVNGTTTPVRNRVVAFTVPPSGGRVTITVTAPAWSTSFRFVDTARYDRLADPSRNPVITVTTPGGTRIP